MKIAIASPVASTQKPQYGTETVVKNLATELARRGHSVDLLIRPEPGFDPDLEWAKDSVRAIRLDARHKRTLARAIARYAQSHRPDILFSVARRDNLALCWAKPHLPPATPVVISEHLAISDSLRDYPALKRWHRLGMMRRAYRAADAVIGVSGGIASELQTLLGLHHSVVRVMHNPVISAQLLRLADEPIQHPWFQTGQPPVILAIGRLDPHKDFENLLKAFAQVLRSIQCKLVILGEGWQRQELQELAHALKISDSIDMPGFVSNPFPYIRQAKLFALSSRMEGLPTVLIEALGVGTPVVATDCPHGPREILGNGSYGRLVPVGDYTSLAQAILETLTHPLPSNELRQRGMDFSSNRATTKYIELFTSLRMEPNPAF